MTIFMWLMIFTSGSCYIFCFFSEVQGFHQNILPLVTAVFRNLSLFSNSLSLFQYIEMFSSYFGVVIIFLLGLDRYSCYLSTKTYKLLSKHFNVIIVLSAILIAILCATVGYTSNISRGITAEGMVTDFVDRCDIVEVC